MSQLRTNRFSCNGVIIALQVMAIELYWPEMERNVGIAECLVAWMVNMSG
jgi:hypothetical protein